MHELLVNWHSHRIASGEKQVWLLCMSKLALQIQFCVVFIVQLSSLHGLVIKYVGKNFLKNAPTLATNCTICTLICIFESWKLVMCSSTQNFSHTIPPRVYDNSLSSHNTFPANFDIWMTKPNLPRTNLLYTIDGGLTMGECPDKFQQLSYASIPYTVNYLVNL